MKREHLGVPYVDPPNDGWVYSRIKANGKVKRRVPEVLSTDRDDACTTGNIRDWFSKMQLELEPSK